MSHAVRTKSNDTAMDYPRDRCISDLFDEQAARTPDAVAVAAGDAQLTYRELDDRSSRVARYLQNAGLGPGSLVGIAMKRSEWIVVAILGVLKAGCAYVPLDPQHPRERQLLVIDDSGLQVLLTGSSARREDTEGWNGVRLVSVEDAATNGAGLRLERAKRASSDAAYLIYTSGSTGKPKGVVVENRNVVNFFFGMDRAIGCEPGVWLAVTSVTFDISVLELLWTLTRGFTVVVHGDELPGCIAEEIERHGVTHLQVTPSLAYMLSLDRKRFGYLSRLKKLLLGGEALPSALIRRIREVYSGDLYNMYGPTETTIWSTTYRIGAADTPVSVGTPIANTSVYLLGSDLQPVREGEAGELFIGGDGVARGYWNRSELTSERFVSVAWLPAERLYQTGDLARWLPDGTIELLGRADDQIKLRGHRIEPGEVEAALGKIPGVTRCVVVAREDRDGDKRLIAYLQAEQGGPEYVTLLRGLMASTVPDYMVPSSFVFVDTFPLTANGKIDRRAVMALPLPEEAPITTTSGDGHEGNAVEAAVATAWQEALGMTRVNPDDNFFDLGAHSLTVAEVHATLQDKLQRQLSLIDLFQFPTVSALARHLSAEGVPSGVSMRAGRRRHARQV